MHRVPSAIPREILNITENPTDGYSLDRIVAGEASPYAAMYHKIAPRFIPPPEQGSAENAGSCFSPFWVEFDTHGVERA
jgi:hypothetical protein